MFYFFEINNKKVLKNDKIRGAEAFFTTRESILKSADLEELSDVAENNKKEICKYLKIDESHLHTCKQTHSDNIKVVNDNICEPDTDALILTSTDKAIFLNFADCTPIILYSEIDNIGAVVHAGWRGTAKQIVQKTVKKMQSEFNVKPENLLALIGPAICKDCFETDRDVFEQIIKSVKTIPENCFYEKSNKFYVDLKQINKEQLLEIGVKDIEIADYCTFCNNDLFFSYRKEKGKTARHSAVLKLKG